MTWINQKERLKKKEEKGGYTNIQSKKGQVLSPECQNMKQKIARTLQRSNIHYLMHQSIKVERNTAPH